MKSKPRKKETRTQYPLASTSNGAKKLGKLRLRLRVHADDDDEGNEAIVGDHLGLLQGPVGPLLEALQLGSLLPRPLPGPPLPLPRSPHRHRRPGYRCLSPSSPPADRRRSLKP